MNHDVATTTTRDGGADGGAPAAPGAIAAARKPIPNLRWWIVGLLFLSTVLNYVDRQTLSILARSIQNDLGLSDITYARIVQAFLLAYTIAYLLSGRITDRLGTRLSMVAFIVWWSLANVLTAFAASAFTLGLCRFLLGMGEPGNYTVGPKAIGEWFTPRDRGLAYGLFTMGATVGATLAPPLIAWLAITWGWRAAFVVTGLAGLVWAIPWWWLYRSPHEHPRISASELAGVPARETAVDSGGSRGASASANANANASAGAGAGVVRATSTAGASGGADAGDAAGAGVSEGALWRDLLSRRETWLLLLSRLLTDPVWYFYLFWFPKYLTDARGLSLVDVGRVAWVVYLAADIGSVAGGWLSGRFIARGATPIAARKRLLRLAMLTVLAGPVLAWTPSLSITLLCAGLVALGHLAWQVTLSALVIDRFPPAKLATAFGLIAAGSGLGGMLSTGVVGWLVTNYSYAPVFLCMGVLHPLALLLVLRVRED